MWIVWCAVTQWPDQVSHPLLAFDLEDAEHFLLLAVIDVREDRVPLAEILNRLNLSISLGNQRASSKTWLGGAAVITCGAIMKMPTFPTS